MRFGWPFIAIFAALSIVLLSGKVNLMSIGMKPATKEQYNIKQLNRIYGAGCGLIAIILAIVIYNARPYEINWLLTPGISFILLATALASKKFGRKN